MRPWTPFTIQAATAAIPRGARATMTRRRMPQVTTKGPEFHRILRRGGRLRRARTRSPHALLTFCLTSGIKIYVAVRSVARLVSDHLRLFPSTRSGVDDRIFEMRPDPTAPERAFYRGRWRAGLLRESRPAAEMLALLTIGI